jgi:hypothetical protein
MGASHNSYTLDVDTLLRDSDDALETASGAEPLQLDFGNTSSGPAVEQVAYVKGTLVVDVLAMESDTADEEYQIVVQLSDDVAFGSGNVVTRAVIHLGNAHAAADSDDQFGLGRVTLGIDNEHNGILFRHMRLANVIAGTIVTGISYGAFLAQDA